MSSWSLSLIGSGIHPKPMIVRGWAMWVARANRGLPWELGVFQPHSTHFLNHPWAETSIVKDGCKDTEERPAR